MTRTEAIRRMEFCRDFMASNYSDMGEPNVTAFNMAIKALEQEPCEDAVSRQRVIEELRYMDNNGFITRSVNHVVDDIRSIPSVKPLENQPQWIPADERLPETVGYYLVTDDSGGMRSVELSFFVPDCEAPWDYVNVTAWMPLPPSYQGEENG